MEQLLHMNFCKWPLAKKSAGVVVARVATSAVGFAPAAVPDPRRSAREVLVVELLVVDVETAT